MHGYKDHRTDSNQPVYAVHGVNFTMNGFWYKGFCKLFLYTVIPVFIVFNCIYALWCFYPCC
jgi:hypothetical protein